MSESMLDIKIITIKQKQKIIIIIKRTNINHNIKKITTSITTKTTTITTTTTTTTKSR